MNNKTLQLSILFITLITVVNGLSTSSEIAETTKLNNNNNNNSKSTYRWYKDIKGIVFTILVAIFLIPSCGYLIYKTCKKTPKEVDTTNEPPFIYNQPPPDYYSSEPLPAYTPNKQDQTLV